MICLLGQGYDGGGEIIIPHYREAYRKFTPGQGGGEVPREVSEELGLTGGALTWGCTCGRWRGASPWEQPSLFPDGGLVIPSWGNETNQKA